MKTKRNKKGQGSLVQMAGCRYWYARWYRSSDGKRMCVSTQMENEADARVFLNERMAESAKGIVQPSGKLFYADMRKSLLDFYSAKARKSLMVGMNGQEKIPGLLQLDAHFGFPATRGPVATRIDNRMAQEFVKARKEEGAGPAIINRSLACLRRMLTLAKRDKRIAEVPFIDFLTEPKPRKGFIEDGDFYRLFDLLPRYLRPLILFLYRCGVRFGEAKQIMWEQVDLAARTITLESEQTKNSQPRVVPLPAELIPLLEEIEPKVGRVFDTTNWRKAWVAACVAAGLGKIENPDPARPNRGYVGTIVHDLRRSAVRNLVRTGTPEVIVMRISGHKTRSVFDRYNIVSSSDVLAAMKRLDASQVQGRRALKG